jgi:hypothetical protein
MPYEFQLRLLIQNDGIQLLYYCIYTIDSIGLDVKIL